MGQLDLWCPARWVVVGNGEQLDRSDQVNIKAIFKLCQSAPERNMLDLEASPKQNYAELTTKSNLRAKLQPRTCPPFPPPKPIYSSPLGAFGLRSQCRILFCFIGISPFECNQFPANSTNEEPSSRTGWIIVPSRVSVAWDIVCVFDSDCSEIIRGLELLFEFVVQHLNPGSLSFFSITASL